eukprot:TRINITY_DN24_c0_g1_i12.p1 TRINITY_DN24_c0_g1~~TRINITY_DN24_c0_g1_i12.p1  ORF type:complete len:180 (+),score=16.15 TRINITY_DN24_c0_g1_i12:35-574(+)
MDWTRGFAGEKARPCRGLQNRGPRRGAGGNFGLGLGAYRWLPKVMLKHNLRGGLVVFFLRSFNCFFSDWRLQIHESPFVSFVSHDGGMGLGSLPRGWLQWLIWEDFAVDYRLTHLRLLEEEAIHIIREVAAELENPVILYSGGKDSACLVHVARKTFSPEIGRAVQQECRDRSRMPSSA